MTGQKNNPTRGSTGEASISERARTVARWFGVEDVPPCTAQRFEPPSLPLAPGTITLITGASGAGKSTLLQQIRHAHEAHWIDVDRIRLPERRVVDCFDDEDLETVLMMLGRMGLGEVWTYLRTCSQLSEGQRWRLRWTLALWRAGRVSRRKAAHVIVASDEFCSVLDPVTARIVSRCLRRVIDHEPRVCALVASARDDLTPALAPDAIVTCDFGTASLIQTRRNLRR